MAKGYENRDQLILKHLSLVKKVVGRMEFRDHSMDQEDLVSIGVMGLMDAIEKYDPTKKVPFESYASVRIRGTVIDELRRTGRVSRDKIGKLNQYYQGKEELERTLQRTPDDGEIMVHLGLDEKQLSKIHETVHCLSAISLESTIFPAGEGEGFQLMDFLEDRNAPNPEEEALRKERNQDLLKAVKTLNEREQTILQLYYVEELSLKEIAYILEVSVPRVSQIHGKILLKLRGLMETRKVGS